MSVTDPGTGREWRTGDIARWSWKPDAPRMKSGLSPYWCMSCIAEFNGTRFRDTYWHGGSDSWQWTPEEAAKVINLEFVANRDDLEHVGAGAREYYEPHDIVDLRHSNDSDPQNVFIRKGAQRSARVMRERLEYIISRSQSDIEFAQRRIENCLEQLSQIESGDLAFYLVGYSS